MNIEELACWISKNYNCRFETDGKQKLKDLVNEETNILRDTIRETDGIIHMALDELGVPQSGYPSPVANAVKFLTDLRAKLKLLIGGEHGR